MSKPKTWTEKMNTPSEGIKKMTDKGLMYISCPKEIETIIRSIPKGKVLTTAQIVEKLKNEKKVDFTCPLTTGIFVSIVANYAEELNELGNKDVPPYWRVVKPKGYLYDKYLGQKSNQEQYLKKEGIEVELAGKNKRLKIKDFENIK